MSRRPQGTGSLKEEKGSYYGLWRANGKQYHRLVGPIRKPGSRDGLTKAMAEKRLREMIDATVSAPAPVTERLTIEDVATRRVAHLRTKRSKDSYIATCESEIRHHFVVFFGDKAIAKIDDGDIEDFIADCFEVDALAPKSVRNLLTHLSSVFEYAVRKRLVTSNPVRLVERPKDEDVEGEGEIHYLGAQELRTLLDSVQTSRHSAQTLRRSERARHLRDVQGWEWKAIASDLGVSAATAIHYYKASPEAPGKDADLERVERVLYLTAAMTGLRQGELIALRWSDVDFARSLIRVCRNYVHGRFSNPKSRNLRSVPLAFEVAVELSRLRDGSSYDGDGNLVFGHPHTGRPLDRSRVTKRFKAALARAGLPALRFHDLRHTFGTMMAAHPQVSIRRLQEWMGHADIRTTLRYSHYVPADNEAALVSEGFSADRRNTSRNTLSETQTHSEVENSGKSPQS